jgi:hypothetical protein
MAIIAFLVLFTVLALALPLSVEISKKGWNDNILVDSSREIAHSQVAKFVLIATACGFGVWLLSQLAPLLLWLR